MAFKSIAAIGAVATAAVVGTVAAVQLSERNSTSPGTTAQYSASVPGGPASPRPEPITGDIHAGTFREIAEKQMPTVVSISTLTRSRAPGGGDFFGDPSLRRFFGIPDAPTERLLEGAGSGFVIDQSGLVLTNAHVVQNAQRIEVVLFTDPAAGSRQTKQYSAKVLGRDPLTDSALLQVEGARDLPAAQLGNSDVMRPGDWVVAIGNPFALSHTVTVGVISATSRPFPVEGRQQRVLQTDAAINPGNSGGPLINLRGEVVGINTAIVPGSGGTNVGVGFAVPINLVRDLVPQLRQGDVQHGRLGIQVRDIPADARSAFGLSSSSGVLVASVEPGGPAANAGLKPGDVILSVGGETMDDAEELIRVIAGTKPGTQARLTVVRDKAKQDVTVTLGQLEGAAAQAAKGPAIEEGLGLTLSAVRPETARQFGLDAGQGGAIVTAIRPASPAAEAGVRPGDGIVEVNRQHVKTLDGTVSRVRASATAGAPTLLLVMREGQRVFLVVAKPS